MSARNSKGNEQISAEIILKSKSGRSLTGDVAVTSENIKDFQPRPETINEATKVLKGLGFTVSPSDITITITGTKNLFEQTFNITINANMTKTGLSIEANREPTIPSSLQHIAEKVVFIPPPEYFNDSS